MSKFFLHFSYDKQQLSNKTETKQLAFFFSHVCTFIVDSMHLIFYNFYFLCFYLITKFHKFNINIKACGSLTKSKWRYFFLKDFKSTYLNTYRTRGRNTKSMQRMRRVPPLPTYFILQEWLSWYMRCPPVRLDGIMNNILLHFLQNLSRANQLYWVLLQILQCFFKTLCTQDVCPSLIWFLW